MKRRKNTAVVITLLFISLAFSSCTKTKPIREAKAINIQEQTKNFQQDQGRFTEDEQNTIKVFQNNVDAVVNVSNIKLARMRWFDMDATEVPQGAGSGFVWDKKGHIVTNYHVIHNGDAFHVNFHGDKKQYKAKLIGAEPKKDIAVLKVEDPPKNLTPIEMGKSEDLIVGQKALAIGSPFGLDHTITAGIVSALDRRIPGIGDVTIRGMIQTDCSINPGNSGGPLLNSKGRVIGMNTLIFSNSGSSAGVGFAVPSQSIKRIVPQLIKHGKVSRPGLGVGILPEYHEARFGVNKGIVITVVDENGPAHDAGLEGIKQGPSGQYYLGDVIIAIDGKEVDTFDDIYHALSKYDVGDTVTVTYRRGEQRKLRNVDVQLTEL